MADATWREWVYQKLIADVGVTAIVPVASIYGGGSVTAPPANKPFIVIRQGTEVRGPYPGISATTVSVWVHDEPGDYLRIGQALKAIRAALVGAGGHTAATPGATGGVACRWAGESDDLADDFLKTIVRNASYSLNGKDGNA